MEKLIRKIPIRNRLGIQTGVREVQVKYLVLHTTASNQKSTWQDLARHFAARWGVGSAEGYHISINADGSTNNRINADKVSNGIFHFKDDLIDISNSNTINISWIGGVMKNGKDWIDNRTEAQKATLERLTLAFTSKYGLTVLGHNQIAQPPNARVCPCFSVPDFAKEIGVPEKQIYTKDNFNVLRFIKTGRW